MLGVLVNTGAILLGGTLGLLCKRGIPKRLTDALMCAVALCVIFIGVDGMLGGGSITVAILSMTCGALVGTLIDLDRWLTRLGERFDRTKNSAGEAGDGGARPTFSAGFISGTLLFCVGAMAIVGSLSGGLTGDYTTLYAKALLDGISSLVIGASLGAGILLSSLSVLVYQGAIVLLSGLLAPLLTDAIIAELTTVGSILILALGLNTLGVTKIKVANLLPALLFAPPFHLLLSLLT